MKKLPRPVENIKAESFLTTFLESCSDVTIEHEGVFSRNYNEDMIDVGADCDEKINIRLSRDSLFHILPEGLFFAGNRSKEAAYGDSAEKQKLLAFFRPFDTAYFRLRFALEKELNAMAAGKTEVLMDELLDIFVVDKEHPLIRKITPLMPLASEIRGNRRVLKDILEELFLPAPVEVLKNPKRYKIVVHIKKLAAKEFNNQKKDADILARCVYEWFLPVDSECILKIKDTTERFILGNSLTLDYNTYLR